jgi:hypothetical protein
LGSDERRAADEPYNVDEGGELGPRVGAIVTDDPTSAAGSYPSGGCSVVAAWAKCYSRMMEASGATSR